MLRDLRSNRQQLRRPVIAFVLGVALGWPVLGYSKGQWCNNTSEATRVELTLKRTTVGGTDVPVVTGPHAGFEMKGEPGDRVSGRLRDPDCVDGTANCIEGSRQRWLHR